MARRPTLRQQIDRLLDQYNAEIGTAFLASVAEVRSQVVLRILVERLERRDLEGALAALNLDRPAFSRLEDAIARAYGAGGSAMVGNLPTLRDMTGTRVVVRFDVRNLRAESWLRDHSSKLVTGILSDQRTALRSALNAGMAAGRGPKAMALDIVGRINRATGKRVGGLIGLTASQERTVENARQALLSGDVEGMRAYMGYKRRDRRFDGTVEKAILSGKGLDQAGVNRITGRLSDRYLLLRGEMIGRTEALSSLNAAGHEAFRQGLEKTNYSPDQVVRAWDSAGDGKVRHTHSAMDGQQVRGLDTPFVSPSGARMLHPGDTSLGAGAEEIIGCRCIERIDVDVFEGRA